jgi:hypothetical protein
MQQVCAHGPALKTKPNRTQFGETFFRPSMAKPFRFAFEFKNMYKKIDYLEEIVSVSLVYE